MKKEDGFTIIELLIASIAFTLLLILVTTIVIQVSKVYYKGVILSNTQNVTSAIVQDVSKNIQFGLGSSNFSPPPTSPTSSGINIYCIGSAVFIYKLGQEFNNSSGNSIGVLYNSSSSCPSLGNSSSINVSNYIPQGYQELLSPNMRIINFTVNQQQPFPLYNISIGVAFGSDQSLCNSNVTNSCTDQNAMDTVKNYANYTGTSVQCKLQQGDQYCATSYLNTTVANEYNLN